MAAYVLLFAGLFLENILDTQSSADFLNVDAYRRDVLTLQFVLFYAPW